MATTAAAAAAGAGGSYEGGGGGAGGKYRRRPLRIPATPYERPPTAIRNPIEAQRKGWMSKIVDPASRLITKSAQRFFSSVFRKNLTAPPTVTEANHESRDQIQEADFVASRNENLSSGTHEHVSNEGDNPNNRSHSNGINDLESILSQKTFTRAEIDRLTELLRSRTADASAENGKRVSDPSTSQLRTADDSAELANVPRQENQMESQKFIGGFSTPAVTSTILEQDVASPADLAKAYMGKRPSRVSPSASGLRGSAFREDLPLLSNLPYSPKSTSLSLGVRSSVRFSGVSAIAENGYSTPRPRGRSAIYSMARTPYSRVHNTGAPKIDGHASPSTSSQWPWENNTISASKQAPKRRISVIDNDIGSVGPIRRIRQKTSMMTPRNIPTAGGSLSNGSNGHNSIPSTSFSSVPSQSTEVAQKIMQQLDKMTPSPKQKSSELRLADAREKSPAKLTLNMLQGQALRSVEDVDPPKLLTNGQHQGLLDGPCSINEPSERASTSQQQLKVEEKGASKYSSSGGKLASEANGEDLKRLTKDTVRTAKTPVPAFTQSFEIRPQKRAFQMSALEDTVDLDDESYSGKASSTPVSAEKEKLVTSAVNSTTSTVEKVIPEKSSVTFSESIPPASFSLLKSVDTSIADGPTGAKKDSGFSFPTTPSPSPLISVAPTSQPLQSFEKAVVPKEQTEVPLFSFGSENAAKASSSVSSAFMFGARPDSKIDTPSTVTWADTVTETAPKATEPNKSDSYRTSENAVVSTVSTSTPPSKFAFGASASTSSLSNGSLPSTSSLFSAPAVSPASNAFTSGISSSTATTTPSNSTNVPTFAISGSHDNANNNQSINAAAPSFSAVPVFQFGSSSSTAASSTSASLPPSTSGVDVTVSEQKSKPTSLYGTTPAFGAASSPLTTTGSGVFGFTASAPSSTNNPFVSNQSQGSNPFGAATGSLFGCPSAPAATGTGVAPFTQSIPSQIGSSASTPTFGLSGSSALSSSNSLFGSSSSAPKQLGSSSFGQSASTTFSSGPSSFNSTSGAGLFGSTSQSTTTPIFGGFGSSPSPAAGFSFGASSGAAPAASSAPVTFGSSLGASSGGSIFSFTSAAPTASATSLSTSGSLFGAASQGMPFGSASPGNDQMNMEDSMAEDTVQASMPPSSAFGQPANSPAPAPFMFGAAPPSAGNSLFQFGSQPNAATPQNPSPFQPTGNLEFSAGGSFSLGTGGGDKSNRKFVKVKRDKLRKR